MEQISFNGVANAEQSYKENKRLETSGCLAGGGPGTQWTAEQEMLMLHPLEEQDLTVSRHGCTRLRIQRLVLSKSHWDIEISGA